MEGFGRLLTRVLNRRTTLELSYKSNRRSLRHIYSTTTTATSPLTLQNLNCFSGASNLSKSLPFGSNRWSGFRGGQKRSMFIQTQSTPNPASLMFYPGKPVMEVGSADFPNACSALNSPLAKALYGIDGITGVFFGSGFITVTKSEEAYWDFLKPEIFAAIMDFYTSGEPLFLDSSVAAARDTAIHEDDSVTVTVVKELLETRVHPKVQEEGGHIVYLGFDPETGIVKLKMHPWRSDHPGYPSSYVEIKSGIKDMLMHHVPEVKGVEIERELDQPYIMHNQLEIFYTMQA